MGMLALWLPVQNGSDVADQCTVTNPPSDFPERATVAASSVSVLCERRPACAQSDVLMAKLKLDRVPFAEQVILTFPE
jgi:hypothetical protein